MRIFQQNDYFQIYSVIRFWEFVITNPYEASALTKVSVSENFPEDSDRRALLLPGDKNPSKSAGRRKPRIIEQYILEKRIKITRGIIPTIIYSTWFQLLLIFPRQCFQILLLLFFPLLPIVLLRFLRCVFHALLCIVVHSLR